MGRSQMWKLNIRSDTEGRNEEIRVDDQMARCTPGASGMNRRELASSPHQVEAGRQAGFAPGCRVLWHHTFSNGLVQ